MDGDGRQDVVVGYPHEECNFGETGHALVFSGATGGTIHHFTSQAAVFGGAVAPGGDIDGDGRADLLISAYDTMGPTWGEAFVYSGKTGKALYTLREGEAERGYGISLASVGDVDRDGIPDILIGACKWTGPKEPGSAWLYSGKTGRLLRRYRLPDSVAAGR